VYSLLFSIWQDIVLNVIANTAIIGFVKPQLNSKYIYCDASDRVVWQVIIIALDNICKVGISYVIYCGYVFCIRVSLNIFYCPETWQ
jgi:hypothetical protein